MERGARERDWKRSLLLIGWRSAGNIYFMTVLTSAHGPTNVCCAKEEFSLVSKETQKVAQEIKRNDERDKDEKRQFGEGELTSRCAEPQEAA